MASSLLAFAPFLLTLECLKVLPQSGLCCFLFLSKSELHFAPPGLPLSYVADQIVTAILEKSAYVVLPKLIYIVFFARAVLPTGLQDKIQEILGLTESYVACLLQ